MLMSKESSVYSTHRKSQLASSQRVLLNMHCDWIKGSQRACELAFPISGKESVNALPKVVGFLRVLLFPPRGNVGTMGWISS